MVFACGICEERESSTERVERERERDEGRERAGCGVREGKRTRER